MTFKVFYFLISLEVWSSKFSNLRFWKTQRVRIAFLRGYSSSLRLIRNLPFPYDTIGLTYVIIRWDKIVKNNVPGTAVPVPVGNRLWLIDLNTQPSSTLVKLEIALRILKFVTCQCFLHFLIHCSCKYTRKYIFLSKKYNWNRVRGEIKDFFSDTSLEKLTRHLFPIRNYYKNLAQIFNVIIRVF